MSADLKCIRPGWPAPARVRAVVTTRQGGLSQPPFDSLNLGDHVGDVPATVAANRQRVMQALALPGAPHWLTQVHGIKALECRGQPAADPPEADAGFTREPGVVCAVLTADCLPLLLADRRGQVVAAVHAGWRGLLDGVIETAVSSMSTPPHEMLAWMGPAIGPQAFEVGAEVREAFVKMRGDSATAFYATAQSGKYLADIYQLARLRLQALGLRDIHGGSRCTYSSRKEFFSFRRDGQCGRMASFIWIAN